MYNHIDHSESLTAPVCIFLRQAKLTNHFSIPALTNAHLYKGRWRVEIFFKWIKQHLRIKSFFGATENAVKTQAWIAVSVYVLVSILKKRLHLDCFEVARDLSHISKNSDFVEYAIMYKSPFKNRLEMLFVRDIDA